MKYGQFCPIAKSLELIGERWSMLILREVLMGGHRFNEIQRGLGGISTALLSKRLKWLCDCNLLTKHTKPGEGIRYFPTQSAQELRPVLMALGNWRMTWTQENLKAGDYDVELLMLYLERSIAFDRLPRARIVIRFEFHDLTEQRVWWLIAFENTVEICTTNPDFDIDLFISVPLSLMTNIWLGHDSYVRAKEAGELTVHGDPTLTNDLGCWLNLSEFEQNK